MRSIVLLTVKPGTEDAVLKSIREVGEVVEVHMLVGLYDLLVIVEAAAREELAMIIAGKIRKLDGVVSTLTLPITPMDGRGE